MKLIYLEGTHYDVGFDYGTLLGQEIIDTYNTLFLAVLPNPT